MGAGLVLGGATRRSGSDPLRVPFGVRSWENVYEPDDIFASALEGSMANQTVRDRITQAASARDLGGPCAEL